MQNVSLTAAGNPTRAQLEVLCEMLLLDGNPNRPLSDWVLRYLGLKPSTYVQDRATALADELWRHGRRPGRSDAGWPTIAANYFRRGWSPWNPTHNHGEGAFLIPPGGSVREVTRCREFLVEKTIDMSEELFRAFKQEVLLRQMADLIE